MATVRTYILAPNFQYKPSGPIQIGNIIADPFRPAKALSTLPAAGPQPSIETVTEHNHALSRDKGRGFSVGVWAQFLQSVGADISAEHGADTLREFSIGELETRYLRDEPADDDELLLSRLREPRVQAAIKSGLFGRQPVYLISGVKIARGLSVRTELQRKTGLGVGATLPVTESVSAGAGVQGDRRDGIASSFEAGEEVVFAYQVHIVKVKGRKRDHVAVDIYESDAALLHGEEVAAEAVSIGPVGESDLREIEELDLVLERCEFTDEDGTTGICIAAKK